MNIQKATQQAVEVGGVIRRKSWPWHALGGPIVIIPGNGPECCQMARIAAGAIMDKCPRWEPEIGDLTANDWTVIKDCKEIPEEPTPRIPYTPERGKFYKNQAEGAQSEPWPGSGPTSSGAWERAYNPFLRKCPRPGSTRWKSTSPGSGRPSTPESRTASALWRPPWPSVRA